MSASVSEKIIEFVPGDDVSVEVALIDVDANGNETVFAISGGATVTANLFKNGAKLIGSSVAQSSSSPADWPNGIVNVVFGDSDTTGLSEGAGVNLSIRVVDGSNTTSWVVYNLFRIHGDII